MILISRNCAFSQDLPMKTKSIVKKSYALCMTLEVEKKLPGLKSRSCVRVFVINTAGTGCILMTNKVALPVWNIDHLSVGKIRPDHRSIKVYQFLEGGRHIPTIHTKITVVAMRIVAGITPRILHKMAAGYVRVYTGHGGNIVALEA